MTIFDFLKEDKELNKLMDEYHKLTGKWPAFNYDEFGSIEEFKESIKKEILQRK